MIPENHAKTVDGHLANLRELASELAEAAKNKLLTELRYTERLRAYEGAELELRKFLNVYRGGAQEKRQVLEVTLPAGYSCQTCGHGIHRWRCVVPGCECG